MLDPGSCPHGIVPDFYPAVISSTLAEIYAQDSVKSCRHISSLIPIKTDFVDERVCVCVCACVFVFVCACVCLWMRVRVFVFVCACV